MSTDTARLREAIAALPQHPPMRLLDRALRIDAHRAVAEVDIRADSPFLVDVGTISGEADADEALGVPCWVALEYLGQTAALIGMASGGGDEAAQMDGFLLGSRRLELCAEPFRIGETLTVTCTACGEVGASLATFEGQVHDAQGRLRADGVLSVVRVPRSADESPGAAETPEPPEPAAPTGPPGQIGGGPKERP